VTGEFILKTNYYSKRKISLLAETANTDRITLRDYNTKRSSSACCIIWARSKWYSGL